MTPSRLLPALGLLVLLGSHPARGRPASLDSLSSASGPPTLRGTVEPLARRANPVRQAGRAVLLVPYASVYAATAPVRGLVYLNERAHLVQRVSNWLTYRYEFQSLRLETFFGYESELGFAVAGFELTQEDWRGERGLWKLKGGFLRPDKNLLALRLQTPEGAWQFAFLGHFSNESDRPFYGPGPASEDRRLGANRRRALAEAVLGWHPHSLVQAGLTGYARNVDLSDPRHEDPVSDVFVDLAAAAASDTYVGMEGSLAVDGRDAGAYSTRGALVRTWGGLNLAQSEGDDDYAHYGAEAQLFVNLYHHTRILALRGFVEAIEADANDVIPYPELERLGGRTGDRGYPRYRFADRAQILLTAEYRYRITHFIQAGLFADWGTVGSEITALRLADIDPSYGFELNVGRRRPLTLQIAHSPEGFQLFLGSIALFDLPSRRLR